MGERSVTAGLPPDGTEKTCGGLQTQRLRSLSFPAADQQASGSATTTIWVAAEAHRAITITTEAMMGGEADEADEAGGAREVEVPVDQGGWMIHAELSGARTKLAEAVDRR